MAEICHGGGGGGRGRVITLLWSIASYVCLLLCLSLFIVVMFTCTYVYCSTFTVVQMCILLYSHPVPSPMRARRDRIGRGRLRDLEWAGWEDLKVIMCKSVSWV